MNKSTLLNSAIASNKILFDGRKLFELKATHGVPLDFALDQIINVHDMAVDWVGFVEEARKNKWWDFQIYEQIEYVLIDAGISRELQNGIKLRLQYYIMKHPHPEMIGVL